MARVRAQGVCPTKGCSNGTNGGQCNACRAKAEQLRGTARQRGYDEIHARAFRAPVLRREPLCVCSDAGHGHGPRCLRPSSVADHFPRTRVEIVADGDNPNDPQYGRGLCKGCHDKHTASTSQGGWNRR